MPQGEQLRQEAVSAVAGTGTGTGTGLPDWLTWLRYSLFYGLYPMGIASEVALILKASGSPDCGDVERWVMRGVVGLYVPGSWVLYGHMIRQRGKVLGGKGKGKVEGEKKRA